MFAFIVLLVHSYALSGAEPLLILSEVLSSEIAVKSFFVVSGFLIFMSYENSAGAKSYFSKRIRRIYPAYFFIVLASVLLGAVLTSTTLREYASLQTFKYIAANLVFLNFMQPTLPGLFESNALQAVNGALWTLKIEVLFYLSVPIIVTGFRKFGRLPVLITLYLSSVAYSMWMSNLANHTGANFYLELQRQLPGQLVFFLAGAAGYYYFQHVSRYGSWLAILAVAAFLSQSWLPWTAVQPLALAIIVIYFACIFQNVGNFGKYGDFSYGIYILHFPILQLLVAYGLFVQHPWLALFLAVGITFVAAYFLWHLIEKRFLRKSSHYVAASLV